MTETGETRRTGGSSGGARSLSIRPESDAVKADLETEMDTCGKAATFQKQDPGSCSCRRDEEVEEHKSDFGHWRQHQDGSDGRRNTKEKAVGDDRRC